MIALVRANPRFGALWTARTVSFLGDSLSLVALLLYVADHTGQALAVAALLVFGEVLPALFGPLAGALSDRFDLRRIMITCELTQAALTVVIALWLPGLPALLALVAARALAAQVFAPASRTAVGGLVEPAVLPGANAALGLGTNGAEAVGPLMAAVLLPVLGVRGVLLIDAATFLISAALLLRLPAMRRPAATEGGTLAGLREGFGYLRGNLVARAVLFGTFAVVAANGIDDVALVFLTQRDLGGGDSAVAALLSAVGLGLLLGYWLLSRFHPTRAMGAMLLAGFAVSSAGNLLTGLSWAVAVAFGLQAVRGLGIAAMDVAATTMLQRFVPERLQGRVFGAFYGGIGVAAGLSYLGGGLLLDATSPRTTFLVAGAVGLAATAGTVLALRKGTEPAPPETTEPPCQTD
ncbi:MFS transporter [Pseudonocardia eucalypti]|uniref:MFS transporter n=1 Tax=Pseudonocardia eucalypti TaxID=648755 RepID=A0ABP9PCD2_9PSEU|nr:MFS family permease [Pseudonocardia eucalypti]